MPKTNAKLMEKEVVANQTVAFRFEKPAGQEGFARENPHLSFVPVTKDAPAEWSGEGGYMTPELLRQHVDDIEDPIYYTSGPAGMVTARRQMLVEAGANEDNQRTEEFTGSCARIRVFPPHGGAKRP